MKTNIILPPKVFLVNHLINILELYHLAFLYRDAKERRDAMGEGAEAEAKKGEDGGVIVINKSC